VLPSLGETDIVLLTPGQLFPGISATLEDITPVAAIKGKENMAQVIERAVNNWTDIPDQDVTIETESGIYLRLTRSQIREAFKSINKRSSYHSNREIFLKRLLDHMARNLAHDRGDEQPDQETRADLTADFIDDRHVRRVLNLMWMPTTAEKVLTRLYTDAHFLSFCAQGILSNREIALLQREKQTGLTPWHWTIDDIPLLDECADRLGEWVRPKARTYENSEYRELNIGDMHRGHRESGGNASTVAEKAYLDREWVYGHIVVDEAQELSQMAWRSVARRAVRKSLTIVGDLQQSSHPASARSWDVALEWASDKVVIHTLTVTYRITTETVETAVSQLIAAGGTAPDLVSIRHGQPTTSIDLAPSKWVAYILDQVANLDGRACVILPDLEFAELKTMFRSPSKLDFGFGDTALDSRIAVLSAKETKGLEFDVVFVCDPEKIRTQGIRGSDIFVACTRATHRLYLISSD
jgi:DNA helicase IV